MMKKKTKQDFQELLKTEHCETRLTQTHVVVLSTLVDCQFLF